MQSKNQDCHVALLKFLIDAANRKFLLEDHALKEYFAALNSCSVELTANSLIAKDKALFSDINTYEFYVTDVSKKENIPTTHKVSEYFNQVAAYIRTDLLSRKNIHERTLALEFWLRVADHCLHHPTLPDLNMVTAINAALEHSAVIRLRATFAGLSGDAKSILDELKAVTETRGSYKAFRDKMSELPHAIPYLGVYKNDFTFIKEGNPIQLRTSHIAYSKHYEIHQRLKRIKDIDFSKRPTVSFALSAIIDEKKEFADSLEREPRNSLFVKKSDIVEHTGDIYKRKPRIKSFHANVQPILNDPQPGLFIIANTDFIPSLFDLDTTIILTETPVNLAQQALTEFHRNNPEKKLAQVYLFKRLQKMLNNVEHHLNHQLPLIDEHPLRKVIAALYLLLKQPSFFQPLTKK